MADLVDLFELAAENAGALQGRYEALLAAREEAAAAPLRGFARCVQHSGRISINMKPSDLIAFLELGRHRNMHELAAEEAARTGEDSDAVLRRRLKGYYARRMGFDGHFRDGHAFRYGALNAGGCGVTIFGQFCGVFRDELSRSRREVAYLRSDSLATYVSPDGEVDEQSVREEAAPHSHRHCLATLKHCDSIPTCEAAGWPSLLCSGPGRGFVEAVFTGEARPGDLEAVRLAKSEQQRHYDDLFDAARGALSRARGAQIDQFIKAVELLEVSGVALEVTDGA